MTNDVLAPYISEIVRFEIEKAVALPVYIQITRLPCQCIDTWFNIITGWRRWVVFRKKNPVIGGSIAKRYLQLLNTHTSLQGGDDV